MIKHFFAPWLCAAFCLVAVCGSHQSAQAASKNVKLAFVTNNASDFWTIPRAGCTKASQDLGNVSVEFKIPEDGTRPAGRMMLQMLGSFAEFERAGAPSLAPDRPRSGVRRNACNPRHGFTSWRNCKS